MNLRPSWETFKRKAAKPTESFEKSVAKYLFCDHFKVLPETLISPPTEAGIECEPILTVEGWVSFQAKFSNDGKQNINQFKEVLPKSFAKKQKGVYQLDKIYCYSSGKATSTQTRKKLEEQASVNNIILVWRFEDQIIDAVEKSSLTQVRLLFFEEHPQPILIKYNQQNTEVHGAYKYHFSLDRVPFKGRLKELQSLLDFCKNNLDLFSWWSIVGTGLVGKSRLAFQLGLELGDDWNWGWFNPTPNTFRFQNWTPDKNTLIIIDYIIGRENYVEQLLSSIIQLMENNASFFKIRLLLIERSYGEWLERLKLLPNFGKSISESIYKEDPIYLESLSYDDLIEIAKVAIKGSEYNWISPVELVESSLAMSKDKAPFLIQILADNGILNTSNLFDFLKNDIAVQKNKRWNAAGIDDVDEDALTLACLSNGILLQPQTFTKKETKSFFSNYKSYNKYSVMVGRPINEGYMHPLEPDTFGEVYVLEKLKPLNELDEGQIARRLLNLAMGINNGQALIAFFTRCSRAFPNHPSLQILKSPFGEEKEDILIWSLTISNVIDVLVFDDVEKVSIFSTILRNSIRVNLVRDSINIEKLLFIRLLNSLSPEPYLSEYLGFFVVTTPELSPAAEANLNSDDIKGSLLPLEYCKNVIESFSGLGESLKQDLVGPHLIEIYNHLILRYVSDRSIDFNVALEYFDMACDLMDYNSQDNYPQTIILFQLLCSNFSASLLQFNRLDADKRLDQCLNIKKNSLKYITSLYDGKPIVTITSHMASIYQSLSVYISRNPNTLYSHLISLIKEFRKYFPLDAKQNAEFFVGTSVQLAHGFESKEDFDYFFKIYKECKLLMHKYQSNKIIESFSLMSHQMFMNLETKKWRVFFTDEQKDLIWSDCFDLATKYPQQEFSILKYFIQALSMHYNNAIVSEEYSNAQFYSKKFEELLKVVPNVEYSDQKKIWVGETVVKAFIEYVNGNDNIQLPKTILIEAKSKKYLNIEQPLSRISADLFNSGQRAKNNGDSKKLRRSIESLLMIKPYVNQNIDQFIEILYY